MAEIVARRLKLDGRTTRVWTGGEGPPLVLLHGGFGAAETHWGPVWAQLADYYLVVAPDLPGFGGSDALPSASYDGYVDWLGDLLRELELPRPVIAGHTFGAAIARLFAVSRPDRLTHLVMISGGAIPRVNLVVRWFVSRPWVASWAFELTRRQTYSRRGLARLFADQSNLTPEFVAAAQTTSRAFAATMRQVARARLPVDVRPKTQTLVLWGAKDRIVLPSRGHRIATQMVNAQFWAIDGAGHLPQLEQPETFLEAMRQFIEGA